MFDGAAAVRHLVVFAGLGPGFPTLQGAVPWHNAIRRLKEVGDVFNWGELV